MRDQESMRGPASITTCQLCVTSILFNKSSAVAEMGDRGHNRHGPKEGGGVVPLSRSAGNPSNIYNVACAGVLPYQVASSSIQPFGHNSV